MNKLPIAKQIQVVSALVEGNSIRATVRMTGVAKNTIAKLLVELGAACSEYMNRTLVNLPCKLVQVDEVWSFVYAKQKNVRPKHFDNGGYAGDVWTWVAIDADTKLVPCFMIGQRDPVAANDFMKGLASRLANRIQLTSDGLRVYLKAVDDAFGDKIDYAMLVKVYGSGDTEGNRRYSPPECIACERKAVTGNPDPKLISTSYVERQNLTVRMQNRRFTRLTNAFSKKVENHLASLAIHYAHYNFCRIHQSLRITPAMAAGLATTPWEIEDLLKLLA